MNQVKVSSVAVSEIWMRGTGMDSEREWSYEGEVKNWVVRYDCGAVDNDGERIVACGV